MKFTNKDHADLWTGLGFEVVNKATLIVFDTGVYDGYRIYEVIKNRDGDMQDICIPAGFKLSTRDPNVHILESC